MPTVVQDREIDNFPLVNVSHPDLERHPLFADAQVFTVDVPAGSALLLPAYWYHQVESFADPGSLNVAVNYWYQVRIGRGPSPTRLPSPRSPRSTSDAH